MNIIRTLQEAIEFMENNMFKPITNEDVAKEVYMTSYHFHRIFSMITDMSVKVYLRNRRMSLAGEEVILTKEKIIDIAYKYCYSTPESFTKSFIRFHGISPSVARRTGGGLKMFNRLQIMLTTKGGKTMDYRIEKREAFKVLAKVRMFNADVIDEDSNTEAIPSFWQECYQEGVIDTLNEKGISASRYGLCTSIDKKSNDFKYGIGVEVNEQTEHLEGYELWTVEYPLWAVFKCYGSDPDCVGETWSSIFKEFLPASEYQMADYIDFEYYPEDREEGLFCEIWIPVTKEE